VVRRFLQWLVVAAAFGLAPGLARGATTEPARVIAITAKMFAYAPAEIVVRKGIPVTLRLMSIDRVHGFNLPDFHVRTTVQPWETSDVTFVPDKIGRFVFACDHFCGDGHDDMSGVLVVVE
jgi:cytochrome c oxidase subunit 2